MDKDLKKKRGKEFGERKMDIDSKIATERERQHLFYLKGLVFVPMVILNGVIWYLVSWPIIMRYGT